jgi:(p)ppGpp synthase/HD superfamily hydrolase
MTLFEKALSIALAAHLRQAGHDGREYIRHVLRVAGAVSSDDEKLIALLHDVIEKSSVTLDNLRN